MTLVNQLNLKEFVKYKGSHFISKTAGAVVVVSKIHAEVSEQDKLRNMHP